MLMEDESGDLQRQNQVFWLAGYVLAGEKIRYRVAPELVSQCSINAS